MSKVSKPDPQGAEGQGIWGHVTAAELLADAKMLEAVGQCGCFDFHNHTGPFSYVCANHDTTTRHPLGGTERE